MSMNRRTFLTGAAAAAAIVTTIGKAGAAEHGPKKTVKIGDLVGKSGADQRMLQNNLFQVADHIRAAAEEFHLHQGEPRPVGKEGGDPSAGA